MVNNKNQVSCLDVVWIVNPNRKFPFNLCTEERQAVKEFKVIDFFISISLYSSIYAEHHGNKLIMCGMRIKYNKIHSNKIKRTIPKKMNEFGCKNFFITKIIDFSQVDKKKNE